MFNGLKRRIARLPLVVLGGLALIILALPGVAGWFIANGVWDNGVAGAIAPYALVALLITLVAIADPIIAAVLAFVVYVPVTYLLVLVMHVILGSLHLSLYTSVGDFLFRNWDGVLLGAGFAALSVGKSSRGDLGDTFLAGLNFRISLAFFIAGLMDIPQTLPARITLGVAWGVVAAVSALIFTP
jgi:hypothetical protein